MFYIRSFAGGIALVAVTMTGALSCGGRNESSAVDGAGPGLTPMPGAGVGNGPRVPLDTAVLARTFGDTLSWSMPQALEVVGDALIVGDQRASPHLTVVDLRTGELAARVGRSGEGPNEFRAPLGFARSAGAGGVWVFDVRLSRLTLMDLQRPDRPVFLEQFHFTQPGGVAHVFLSEIGAIAVGLLGDYAMSLSDSTGGNARRIRVKMPYTWDDIPDDFALAVVNMTMMASHPDGTRLALVYRLVPRVDFFTTKGEYQGTTTTPFEVNRSFRWENGRLTFNADDEWVFLDAVATNDHVYALFCGCPAPDVVEYQMPRTLYVFSWSGELVAKIAVAPPLDAFTVTPDGSRLYGIYEAFGDDFPAVGEWSLPVVR